MVFLPGQTEAPLTIKPFLPIMTPSELHCIMASGMATIAGSVLFAYTKFGVSASHLLRFYLTNSLTNQSFLKKYPFLAQVSCQPLPP